MELLFFFFPDYSARKVISLKFLSTGIKSLPVERNLPMSKDAIFYFIPVIVQEISEEWQIGKHCCVGKSFDC